MTKYKLSRPLILSVISANLPAFAWDFHPADGVDARLGSTTSLGTMIRTTDPSPADYAVLPSMVAGAPTGHLMGQTGGSDLNFAKNRPVSTVLKSTIDLDVHSKDKGLFVRGTAWYDATLGHADAAYGNFSNGFQAGAPLSDAGQAQGAKFNGLMLRDAYIWGRTSLNEESTLEARLGRQVLNWGVAQMSTGGISSAITPNDLAAQTRPGALPQESKVAMGMLDLKLTLNKRVSAEGFLPYESRATTLPACGTFFDTSSFTPSGCNLAAAVASPLPSTLTTLDSLTERSLINSQYYIHRNPDAPAKSSGQYGVALHFKTPTLETDYGVYIANMHNFMPTYRLTLDNNGGAPFPAGLAGGLARLSDPNGMKYATAYAENIRMFGASFDTKVSSAQRIFGEVAYRPNQPITMNPTDLVTGFLLRGNTSLLQLNKDILAIPAGGTFDAFDRFAVSTYSLGGNQLINWEAAGARVALAAEVAGSHVSNLPDPEVMRYGRSLAYGAAPYQVNGVLTACAVTTPGLNGVTGKTCTTDGFVSPDAYGWRARAAITFTSGWLNATWTPSLLLTRDVHGYAYDGSFSQGRMMARVGLRADWDKRYFADVQVTKMAGGNYNLAADRSNMTLVAGVSF